MSTSCRSAAVHGRVPPRWPSNLHLDCTIHDDYEQVLADDRVDIVNMSGPNHVHAEQAIAAAKTGRHLLVEKPMALSMEENARLREAVARPE